jgi:hypothetical protein
METPKKLLQCNVTALLKNITIVTVIALFSGCTAYHYVSSPQYVPLHDNKGSIIANISTNGYQLGYALTDNFNIFTIGSIAGAAQLFKDGGKENSGHKSGLFRQYIFDAGAGIYKKGKLFNYELLAGAGGGKIAYKNEIDEWPADYLSVMNAKKVHVYCQPDFGYKLKEFLVVGVFSKINFERYYDIQSETQIGSHDGIDPDDLFFQNRQTADFSFIEPGILLRAGMKHVKFYIEYSIPLLLYKKDIVYRKMNLFAGLTLEYNFDKK